MATILLFHHALGQTPGFFAFADELRAAGHAVHAPDLFEGRTFPTIEDGVAHAEAVGFEEIIRRGKATADPLPPDIVYAGFSLGVLSAQSLAQTRAGARGALLYYSCVPTAHFGGPWPERLPVQIHIMDQDPIAEEDRDAAREVVKGGQDAELFLYSGSAHYFADSSFKDYDAAAAGLLMERTISFLLRVS